MTSEPPNFDVKKQRSSWFLKNICKSAMNDPLGQLNRLIMSSQELFCFPWHWKVDSFFRTDVQTTCLNVYTTEGRPRGSKPPGNQIRRSLFISRWKYNSTQLQVVLSIKCLAPRKEIDLLPFMAMKKVTLLIYSAAPQSKSRPVMIIVCVMCVRPHFLKYRKTNAAWI